jgi:hypothetical protein
MAGTMDEEDYHYYSGNSGWMRVFYKLFWALGWGFLLSRHKEQYGKKKSYLRWRWEFGRRRNKVRTRQHVTSVSSESYWFSPPTRMLSLKWTISTSRRKLKLAISIPFVCMHYIRICWANDVWFAKKLRGEFPNDLDYGLLINDSALSWDWGQDSMAWSRDGSTGFHFYHSWDKYREKPRKEIQLQFTSTADFTQPAFGSRPETEHTMTVKYEQIRLTYWRPWNKSVTHYWADISFEGGKDKPLLHPPAFSGKGENSWDCGDDGIWGCTVEIPRDIARSLFAFADDFRSYHTREGAERSADWIKERDSELSHLKQAVLRAACNGYIAKVEKERQRRG